MLLGNYNVFSSNPGREMGGITNPVMWMKSGSVHNFFCSDANIIGETNKAGFPAGYGSGGSWALPPKAGGLSSHRNGTVSLSQTAALVGGLPGSGSASISITATATGGLIVLASGSSTITLDASGNILSVAAASGSASISFSPSATLGGEASLSGSATISLSGSATSYAIGYLSGTSSNETEFSPDVLARAVWDAVASDFNLAGTMGKLLNDAGASGNPWSASLASNNSAGTFGEFVQDLPAANDIATALLDLANGVETDRTVREALRLILSAVAGKLSGAGTTQVKIRDAADTKDRITATVDAQGNRTAITYDDT